MIRLISFYKSFYFKRVCNSICIHSRFYCSPQAQETSTKYREFPYSFIKEGKAEIYFPGSSLHFYNPRDEPLRNLSIAVLSAFLKYKNAIDSSSDKVTAAKKKDGFSLLELIAGSGCKSLRYALEVGSFCKIIVNESTFGALNILNKNIKHNHLEHIMEASNMLPRSLLFQFMEEKQKFDFIELEGKGCLSQYFDVIVQSVVCNGLLMITFKNCSSFTEKNADLYYSRYGVSTFACNFDKELGIRMLLQALDVPASRSHWYITPLLSFHGRGYIKLFLLITDGREKNEDISSKKGFVYKCTGCETFHIQPLGRWKIENEIKTFIPSEGLPISQKCKHCNSTYEIGGPIWIGKLHEKKFVSTVISHITENLSQNTCSRNLLETLNIIQEELDDCLFYYDLEEMSSFLHMSVPKMLSVRSALANAGYRVSLFHGNLLSIKTDASSDIVWDIMRCWRRETSHNITVPEDSPAAFLLKQQPKFQADFTLRHDVESSYKKVKVELPMVKLETPVRKTKSRFSRLS